jgi:hypothetical protein
MKKNSKIRIQVSEIGFFNRFEGVKLFDKPQKVYIKKDKYILRD